MEFEMLAYGFAMALLGCTIGVVTLFELIECVREPCADRLVRLLCWASALFICCVVMFRLLSE